MISSATCVYTNGEPTNLRMLYHRDRDEYEVLGTWDGIDAKQVCPAATLRS